MKSLAATFLIFVTCIVVSGTNALIDRAQSILSASSGAKTAVGETQSGVRNETTLAEFARATQEKLRLAQPSYLVTFDDLRPNDPNYSAAQAVYPFLHRQLLAPNARWTHGFLRRMR